MCLDSWLVTCCVCDGRVEGHDDHTPALLLRLLLLALLFPETINVLVKTALKTTPFIKILEKAQQNRNTKYRKLKLQKLDGVGRIDKRPSTS